jgi:hypothetical protein
MNEIIYVLINEAMPGYVKIGMTNNDLEGRIRSLDTTSVPLPFECFYASRVVNARETEQRLHDAFLDHRVRSNREFFEIAPERVVSALKLAELENVTPGRDYVESEEDQKALNEARERRAVFNFGMVDIPVGSVIYYIDDETKVATVTQQHGKNTIEFEGEPTSPSAVAQKLRGTSYPLQGTLYWKYEGETLDARRQRMERGE